MKADEGGSNGAKESAGESIDEDLKDVFGRWMADQEHVRIAQFFRRNPGVIENLQGLAVRLGTSVKAIEAAVRDHIQLGLLVEKQVGPQVVLRYSQKAHKQLEQKIVDELGRRSG